MKKIITLFVPLLLLYSCGTMKPQTVAGKYLKAMSEGNFDDARGYITFRSFGAFEEVKQAYRPGTYDMVSATPVSETEFIVQYLVPDSDSLHSLTLIQRKDRWRIELEP